MRFQGKVVIVTGAAHGIGRAIALAFAGEGASVTAVDINRKACIQLLRSPGGQEMLGVNCDVSNAAECRGVIRRTVDEFGGVDILVSSVGIQPPESYTNVEDTSEKMWRRILDVNLTSHFLMAKYAIPEMRKRGGGIILEISSVQGFASMEKVPVYAAAKGALVMLTKQMALDYARDNIRVLGIAPGTIDTEMVRTMARLEEGDVEATLARWGALHPLGRIGRPEEIANVALFLASDGASFMTGSTVFVDGGYMALGPWGAGTGASRK